MNVTAYFETCRVPRIASDEWGADRQAIHNALAYVWERCGAEELPATITPTTAVPDVVAVLGQLVTTWRRGLRFPADTRRADMLASQEGDALQRYFQPGMAALQQSRYQQLPFRDVFS